MQKKSGVDIKNIRINSSTKSKVKKAQTKAMYRPLSQNKKSNPKIIYNNRNINYNKNNNFIKNINMNNNMNNNIKRNINRNMNINYNINRNMNYNIEKNINKNMDRDYNIIRNINKNMNSKSKRKVLVDRSENNNMILLKDREYYNNYHHNDNKNIYNNYDNKKINNYNNYYNNNKNYQNNYNNNYDNLRNNFEDYNEFPKEDNNLRNHNINLIDYNNNYNNYDNNDVIIDNKNRNESLKIISIENSENSENSENNENRNAIETTLISIRDSIYISKSKDKDKLEEIPEININGTSELEKLKTKNCTICLEDFKVKDKVIYLPCFHLFHKDCIINWVKLNSTCPLCKININENIN